MDSDIGQAAYQELVGDREFADELPGCIKLEDGRLGRRIVST